MTAGYWWNGYEYHRSEREARRRALRRCGTAGERGLRGGGRHRERRAAEHAECRPAQDGRRLMPNRPGPPLPLSLITLVS